MLMEGVSGVGVAGRMINTMKRNIINMMEDIGDQIVKVVDTKTLI